MFKATVSVIVPVKDDDRVVRCVRSVLACAEEVDAIEIIVVDNGCDPEFVRRLGETLPPQVKRLSLAEPGVYAARNAGVGQSIGHVVFFTDADCLVRPGWIVAGLQMLGTGAEIVQGYSGSLSTDRAPRLLQARYEKHLRNIVAGDPTECDTRNMAVTRRAFDDLRFNPGYRRVGDTEFGLVAEARGLRVAYAPAMRVDHEHEPDFQLFVAKQICHGWGAQRLMQEHPDLRWHGGHLKAVSRFAVAIGHFRRLAVIDAACRHIALAGARVLQRSLGWLPGPIAYGWLTCLDKLAALAGHFSYVPGEEEPSPSLILARQLPRD